MCRDGIQHLVVGEGRIAEPQIRVRRARLAQDIAHREAGARQQLHEQSPAGGVFRYSTTCGSIPALRIIARMFRDVPQDRIVIDHDVEGTLRHGPPCLAAGPGIERLPRPERRPPDGPGSNPVIRNAISPDSTG